MAIGAINNDPPSRFYQKLQRSMLEANLDNEQIIRPKFTKATAANNAIIQCKGTKTMSIEMDDQQFNWTFHAIIGDDFPNNLKVQLDYATRRNTVNTSYITKIPARMSTIQDQYEMKLRDTQKSLVARHLFGEKLKSAKDWFEPLPNHQ